MNPGAPERRDAGPGSVTLHLYAPSRRRCRDARSSTESGSCGTEPLPVECTFSSRGIHQLELHDGCAGPRLGDRVAERGDHSGFFDTGEHERVLDRGVLERRAEAKEFRVVDHEEPIVKRVAGVLTSSVGPYC
jgi:hypothetical protein